MKRVALYIVTNEEDRDLFKAAAEHEGLTLTAWIRRLALREARKVMAKAQAEEVRT